jgi:hypothetical protein
MPRAAVRISLEMIQARSTGSSCSCRMKSRTGYFSFIRPPLARKPRYRPPARLEVNGGILRYYPGGQPRDAPSSGTPHDHRQQHPPVRISR